VNEATVKLAFVAAARAPNLDGMRTAFSRIAV
jgi:hypothetical protein